MVYICSFSRPDDPQHGDDDSHYNTNNYKHSNDGRGRGCSHDLRTVVAACHIRDRTG